MPAPACDHGHPEVLQEDGLELKPLFEVPVCHTSEGTEPPFPTKLMVCPKRCCCLLVTSICLSFLLFHSLFGMQRELSKHDIPKVDDKMMSWKCCVPTYAANPTITNTSVASAAAVRIAYSCEKRPSNFSWYYGYSEPLNVSKWMPTKIYFAGGSTTRQMREQLQWEMAPVKMPLKIGYDSRDSDRFLFLHHQKGSAGYVGRWILDMRALSPSLVAALDADYHFIILNVGTWWPSNSIGKVIDSEGITWPLLGMKQKQGWVNLTGNDIEWQINKNQISQDQAGAGKIPPDVSFSNMMRRALLMIMKRKKPGTTIVWRSETKTDCPVGSNYRATISSVLKELDIHTLNISESTCQYAALDIDDSNLLGPHLCFPSVALRYWLQEFQRYFL